MDIIKKNFNEVSSETWDRWLEKFGGATYLHTSAWIKYISEFYNVIENASFCLLANDNSPLAICPLILNKKETEDGKVLVIGSNELGIPVLSKTSPIIRKKILKEVFKIYSDYAEEKKAVSMQMVDNPLTIKFCTRAPFPSDRMLEFEKYHLFQRVSNTIVIDLSNSENTLYEDMSKYHHRHIKRAAKKGFQVKVFNNESSIDELTDVFTRYKNEHFKSSGKLTRPQRAWDLMRQMIFDKRAELFINYDIHDNELSYLFCGQYYKMAYGWSQVNVGKYEKESSLRHYLEWEAISYYKKKGYHFYELGGRYYSPSPLFTPTKKQISIGIFKERYGGLLLPKVFWKGYFNREYMVNDLPQDFKKFIGEYTLALSED